MGEAQDNGGPDPKRSRPAFDPVAGMRAVADIQAEGLRAAGDLLERILRSEPEAPGTRPPSSTGGVGALVEAWTDLLQRTLAAMATPGEPGALTVAIDANGAGPQVRLAVDETGAGEAAEVWLHNGTFTAVGPLAPRCGPLSDADGAVLDGAEVGFEPREVDAAPGPVEPRRGRLARRRPDRCARAPTAARSKPRARPGCGYRSRSWSSRADRRRGRPRPGLLRRRQPPRAPRDARRHPRRRAAPLALSRRARRTRAGPGKALRPALCVATSRAFGGSDARRPAGRRGDRAVAQRLPRPRRHRRRQRAPPRAPDARRRVRPRARAQRRRRARRALQPGSAPPREPHGRRPRRPRARRSSTPWRCGRSRARPPSSAGGATASRRSSPRTTST